MGLLRGLFRKGPKVIAPWSQQRGYTGGHRKGAPLTGSRARRRQTVPGRRLTPSDTAFNLFRW
jgi:hypothetical protein